MFYKLENPILKIPRKSLYRYIETPLLKYLENHYIDI